MTFEVKWMAAEGKECKYSFLAVIISKEILSALCLELISLFFLFSSITLLLFHSFTLLASGSWRVDFFPLEYCDRSYDYVFIVMSISSVPRGKIYSYKRIWMAMMVIKAFVQFYSCLFSEVREGRVQRSF